MNYHKSSYNNTEADGKNYGIGSDGQIHISSIPPAGTPSGAAMPTSGMSRAQVSANVMPSSAYPPHVIPPDVYPTGLDATYESSGAAVRKASYGQGNPPLVSQQYYQGAYPSQPQSFMGMPWSSLTKEQKQAYKNQFQNWKEYKKSEEKRAKYMHKLDKLEPNKLSSKLEKIDKKLQEQEFEVNELRQQRQQLGQIMASKGLINYMGGVPQQPLY